MKKPKLTKKELADIEAKKKKAADIYRENQKREPGPITAVDVARVLGMPEEMIEDLFGEEKRNSEDNKTGTGPDDWDENEKK